MNQPPDRPWLTGEHPEYTSFALLVRAVQDKDGGVWSEHDFHEDADREAAMTLPTRGGHQVAHALLVEAVRRECFLDVLIEMSKDPTYLQKWVGGTWDEQRRIEGQLAAQATRILQKAMVGLTEGGVRDILEMLALQGAASEGESG